MNFNPDSGPADDPEHFGQPPHPPQTPTYHQEVQHSSATARVPEHIGGGVFATGAIVMHGMHEFVIDFIQSLAPPKRIVARVALPPTVIPPFVAALQENIAKYRQNIGPLQRPSMPGAPPTHQVPHQPPPVPPQMPSPPVAQSPEVPPAPAPAPPPSIESGQIVVSPTTSGMPHTPPPPQFVTPGAAASGPAPQPAPPPITDVYQQLKLPDEILSGVYANTVMIVHGLAEFCFDFITSFYPRSAVSCRVSMAAPHAVELLDSLKRSLEQFRQKQSQFPPPRPPE